MTAQLSDVAYIIRKIAYGRSLTTDEARQVLNVVGELDSVGNPTQSDGMYFLALTFGIMAKSPTVEELYGFILSIADQSLRISCDLPPENIIDVSGTGGDKIKTFNVGTAVSFVTCGRRSFFSETGYPELHGLYRQCRHVRGVGSRCFSYVAFGRSEITETIRRCRLLYACFYSDFQKSYRFFDKAEEYRPCISDTLASGVVDLLSY